MKRLLRFLLSVMPLAAAVAALLPGEVPVTPAALVRLLCGTATPADLLAARVLLEVRLPMALQAFLCGGLLGISGAALQAVLRNPLAEPYVLGVSSGCALGMVLAALCGAGGIFLVQSGAAFLGGTAAAALVLAGAFGRGRVLSLGRLVLLGVAVSAFLSALTMLVQSFLDPWRFAASVGLLMGEITLLAPGELLLAAGLALPAVAYLLYRAPELDILSQGREAALVTGVSADRVLTATVAAASLATAVSVALCGVVGFIGLAAPHAVRMLRGTSRKRLFPLSFLTGGGFLLLAHLVVRLFSPAVPLPLTAVTALAGAPFFFWIIRRAGGADVAV